jgi:type IX secretion system PorP/SprF family membrane protein
MNIRPILSLIFILTTGILFGQQYPLFSHYTINKFGFNPGVVGLTEKPEARFIFRSQWVELAEAPETQILSMQGKYKDLPIGFGGYLYNDQVGHLQRTGGSAAVALAQKIVYRTTISIGLGAGYYNIRLRDDYNARDLTDLTLAEAGSGQGFPDFSAGVYLKREGLFVGFSVPQILQPKLKFTDDNIAPRSELVRHYYGMAGYKFKVNDHVYLEPSGLLKLVENAPLQYDVSLRIFLKNLFWVGGSYRSEAAAAFLAGVDLNEKFLLAYAYDLTTSDLNTVSNGSHEITLGYRFGKTDDTDKDGVPDVKDECPDEPGPKENAGCPDDEPIAAVEEPKTEPAYEDWDRDGIRDDIDKCPKIPGVASNQGCPIDDRDKDGIVDERDKCPDVAGSFAMEGCPGTDADEDGVLDDLDDCPNEPGPKFNSGCPVVKASNEVPAKFLEMADFALRNVYFDSNADDIRREHIQELDHLSEFLVKYPEVKIQLTGHTDERSSDEYNYELSKRRVESVTFYLINRGVSRQQVVSEYYGEIKPVDVRKSESSYQLNRRVELKLLFN